MSQPIQGCTQGGVFDIRRTVLDSGLGELLGVAEHVTPVAEEDEPTILLAELSTGRRRPPGPIEQHVAEHVEAAYVVSLQERTGFRKDPDKLLLAGAVNRAKGTPIEGRLLGW